MQCNDIKILNNKTRHSAVKEVINQTMNIRCLRGKDLLYKNLLSFCKLTTYLVIYLVIQRSDRKKYTFLDLGKGAVLYR